MRSILFALVVLLLAWDVPSASTAPSGRAGRPPELPQADGYRSPGNRHKVQVSDAGLAAEITAQGGRMVADYGGFKVFEVDDRLVRALGHRRGVTVRDEDNVVMLHAGAVDTTLPAVQAERRAIPPFSGRRMHLVQFAGPIRPEWYEALVGSGVRVVSYIPNNAYLVYGTQAALLSVRALRDRTGIVQWDGEYGENEKVHPEVRARGGSAEARAAREPARLSLKDAPADASGEAGGELYTVQLIADPEENAVTVSLLEHLQLEPTLSQWDILEYRNFVVRLTSEAVLGELAQRPDVVFIEPFVTPEKADERQNQIMASHLTGGLPDPGDWLAYLALKGFTQQQFTDSGFVVDVGDDGIDNATTSPNHPNLYVMGDKANASRVAYARKEGTGSGSEIRGCDGHGTLNSHIVGGYVPFSFGGGFPHADAAGFRYGMGVAPFVKLGSSVVFAPAFTSPNFPDWQSRAYADGARISTNSWGAAVGGAYNTSSQTFDALVRDAQPAAAAVPAPGNQEMVIVFAAGNSGSGANTVGSPGTAKNVITVGAAENVHSHATDNGGSAANGADGCNITDTGADNANDIISFSSRGPTDDGRNKPEIVAPGTHVTGGVFQAAGALPANGQADACFTADSVCGLPSGGRFFPMGQEWYSTSSGTSHSTPATAGAAALIRQYFVNHGHAAPSPAMTKAALMNSARYMTGVSANDTLWSNSQGMGEVNLDSFFDIVDDPSVLKDQSGANTFTASGQVRVVGGTIVDPSKPFRVTLAWTDVPGPTSGNAFVNNLDLEVTVGGNTYKGNVFSGAWSATGGSADFRNNGESVFIPAGVTGSFLVKVTAANVAADGVPNSGGPIDQDFALIVYNAVEAPVPVLESAGASVTAESCEPSNGAPDPGETVTMEFALANVGTGSTTALVATLLPSGGVTAPGGPQSYGALAAGAPAVSRPFTYTADGACGSTIIATLQLHDGGVDLGTVSFPLTVGATLSNTFGPLAGPGPIAVPVLGTATPYPSSIQVTGAYGTVSNVRVRLFGLQHTNPDDLDILLVGPGGQTVVLMSDAGGSTDVSGLDLVFDGDAAQSLPDSTVLGTGTYRPTNYGTGDGFPLPAPAGPHGATLSAFDGINPNGEWTLYVVDDLSSNAGSIAGGWALEITATDPSCCGVALPPLITAAPPAQLTGETCSAPNGAPDPGETVTVELPLVNIGVGATGDLVATLQATGGATAPSGPQSYGSLAPGAPAVSRPFTFAVDAACGSTLTATLALQDGAQDLGTVSFTMRVGSATSNAFGPFANAGAVTVPLVGAAAPYPTAIDVSGAYGTVSNVRVTLHGLTHTNPDDLDVLLVGPGGQAVILVSDAGGSTDVAGLSLTFDDEAQAVLPDSATLASGTYRPTNFGTSDSFPLPAPGSPYAAALSAFDGINPNGTWRLYVVDDLSSNAGSISGGWTLEIATSDPACCGVAQPPLIIAAPPAQLAAESCSAPNDAADPGETVTVEFPLVNIGVGVPGNLVAMLLTGGGVTSPSGPQSYGALVPGAPPASRPFTFTVDAACGSMLTATLHLQDGTHDLGTVSFSMTVGGTTSHAFGPFASNEAITVPLSGAAAPYPTTVEVAGAYGTVSNVRVTLHGVTHANPDDLDVLLVGPGGQAVVLMSDAGGSTDVTGLDLTFDDEAGPALPDSITLASGTYRPTNYGTGDTFAAPAPGSPYGAALSAFDGVNPNGTWRLFVMDDLSSNAGSIGGWSLEIATSDPACCGVPLPPLIIAAPPAELLTESCSAPNGVVDAGETVTMAFPLQNIGVGTPGALTTTLLAGGGVSSPSGPQSYGAPLPGAPPVARPFTFTVDAVCGDVIVATLQLHDGALSLGTLTYFIPTGALTDGTVAAEHSTGDLAVPIPDVSTIEIPVDVADIGEVADVDVRVRLNHTFDADLDLYLVAPNGATVALSTDNGSSGQNYGDGPNDCSGVFTVFDDSAETAVTSGTAPFAGALQPEQALSTLAGLPTRGTWKLRVVDDSTDDVGVVGCVQLRITRRRHFCCGVAGTPEIQPVPPPSLVAECGANAAADPGEIVTLGFPLRNVGTDLTADLVATLETSGGVIAMSGPQSYGPLSPVGPAATREFRLAVDGTAPCGSDVIATLRLQDGADDLGTASFAIRLGRTVPGTPTTFANPTPIVVPAAGTSGAAAPYPSIIDVSGLAGTVSKVSVKLNGLNHTFPGDVDVLLVGPRGQKFILLSDVLGTSDWVNVTYVLDDDAAAVVPSGGTAASGSFKPTNYGTGDTFAAPAPGAPYATPGTAGTATFASVFGGTDPNGPWSLYVVDDATTDIGAFNGGWEITVTTDVPVCETVAPASITGASATPSFLWPPNHAMHDVAVAYDPGSSCVSCSLAVSSNEPEHGTGPDDVAPDWLVLGPNAVRLRAERAEEGTGRIYSIAASCTNGHGTDTETVEVRVPHDRR